ncbi:Fc.00g063320.m01.CDS01 [Cosmosporella sp. VM-42]
MCHTVIAQRMCEICGRNQGETVIDFTKCARKCRSPFYCLTPKPQMEICALCVAAPNSTPVLARHASKPKDRRGSESTSSTSASISAGQEYPFMPSSSLPGGPAAA